MKLFIIFILLFACNSQKNYMVSQKKYKISNKQEEILIQWEFKLKSSIEPQTVGLTMSHPNTDGPSWEFPKNQIIKIKKDLYQLKGNYKLSPFSPKGTYYLIIHDFRNEEGKKIVIDDHIEITL